MSCLPSDCKNWNYMIVLGKMHGCAAVPVERQQTVSHILKQFLLSSQQSIQTQLLNSKWHLHRSSQPTSLLSAVNCFYNMTLIFHLIHILRGTTNSFDISPLWNCKCFVNAWNPSKERSENLVVHYGYFDVFYLCLNQCLSHILIQSTGCCIELTCITMM